MAKTQKKTCPAGQQGAAGANHRQALRSLPSRQGDRETQEQDAWQPSGYADSAQRPWARTGARPAHRRRLPGCRDGVRGARPGPGATGDPGRGPQAAETRPPTPGKHRSSLWGQAAAGKQSWRRGPSPQDHGKDGPGAAARSCCAEHSALRALPRGAPGARAGPRQPSDAGSPVPSLQLAQTSRGVGVGGQPPSPGNPAPLLLECAAQAWRRCPWHGRGGHCGFADPEAHTRCDGRRPAPRCAPQKRNEAGNLCASIRGSFTRNRPGPAAQPDLSAAPRHTLSVLRGRSGRLSGPRTSPGGKGARNGWNTGTGGGFARRRRPRYGVPSSRLELESGGGGCAARRTKAPGRWACPGRRAGTGTWTGATRVSPPTPFTPPP